MERKIKAVIFDLDGTLLDTLCDLHGSVNFAMEHFGYPTHTKDAVGQFVGDGVAKLIERAIPEGRNNPSFDACLDLFKKHYAANMYNHTTAYSGICNALSRLKEKGYALAVVSNKFDGAVKALCEKYFADYIDVAIGECESLGIKKKPAPDTVIAATKALGLAADETVYVGDSEVDIKTALNCGIKCVSVLWGLRDKSRLEDEGAHIFAENTDEMLREIEKLG